MPGSHLAEGQEGNEVGFRTMSRSETSCSWFHRSQRIRGKLFASIEEIKLELPTSSMQSFFSRKLWGVEEVILLPPLCQEETLKERLVGK